jgi:hypothetical protein
LPPTEFAFSIRQPLSQDFTDADEDVHSNGNKEEVTKEMETLDSLHGWKEDEAEMPKTTKRRGGGGRVRDAGGKILDFRC